MSPPITSPTSTTTPLYNYAGSPAHTQARIRSLLDTQYHAAPDGMAGNEDVGQMSAWFLLSALGFYPVDPVSATYVLGSPVINRATLQVNGGKTLTITVKNQFPKNPYIQAFTLNGQPQQRTWFHHHDIANGGTIELTMGPTPHPALGKNTNQLPPSLVL